MTTYEVTISVTDAITVDADSENDAIEAARSIFSLWTADSVDFEVRDSEKEE